MTTIHPQPNIGPYRSSDRQPAAFTEVWRRRALVRTLIERQLKVKYQRSLLGFAWTLMNPLLTLAVLVLVFSLVVRIPVERYWAFLLSGYFVWTFVQQMLTTATYVLAEHAQLCRSVAFPAEVPVLASAGARLVEFVAEMTLVLTVLAVVHHGSVPASWSLLPVLLVIQVLLALALMLPLSVLSVYFTDVQHAVPALMLVGFYATPVFYSLDLVPEHIRPLFYLNPMTGLLTLYHKVLYEGAWPGVGLLAAMAAISCTLFAIGYGVFSRYKLACIERA